MEDKDLRVRLGDWVNKECQVPRDSRVKLDHLELEDRRVKMERREVKVKKAQKGHLEGLVALVGMVEEEEMGILEKTEHRELQDHQALLD